MGNGEWAIGESAAVYCEADAGMVGRRSEMRTGMLAMALVCAAGAVVMSGCAGSASGSTPEMERALAPAESGPLAGVRAQLKSDDEPFALVVTFRVKGTAEAEAKFVKLVDAAVKGTRREKGNVAYVFNRETADPRNVVLYEEWRSFTDLRHHFTYAYVTEFLGAFPEILEAGPELKVYRGMVEAK
jgi:quinol monooxygenase YgiN